MRRKSKPLLITQHAEHEHPAALLRALRVQGTPTHWLQVHQGERLPKASEISSYVSMGGPMGANDELEHPWIAQEIKLMRQLVERDQKVVGICLGGQMLAKALGAEVERNPRPEVGWMGIQLTEHGKKDPILKSPVNKPTVYQWHEDTFYLPKGAKLLAESSHCKRQAFRVGKNAYGFQFHPEADPLLVKEWLEITGVSKELDHYRKKHGNQTVQSASQQLKAARYESLKILMGLCFFLAEAAPYDEIHPGSVETFRDMMNHGVLVSLDLAQPSTIRELTGKIVAVESAQLGDYLLLEEQNSWIWPVRLDRIASIKLAS